MFIKMIYNNFDWKNLNIVSNIINIPRTHILI